MAGREYDLLSLSFEAAADLSGKQYYLVAQSAADKVNLASSQGTEIGVLQNKPESGQEAQVQVHGVTKVISDGSGTAIAVGNKLSTDANGKAVKVTSGRFIGEALGASSADGTIIEMFLMHGGF